jgi:hypothetical protein
MLRGFLNRSSFEAEGQFKRAVHLAFDPICFCSSLKVVQTDVTTCVRFFPHTNRIFPRVCPQRIRTLASFQRIISE